jgi:hypothetical protein
MATDFNSHGTIFVWMLVINVQLECALKVHGHKVKGGKEAIQQ